MARSVRESGFVAAMIGLWEAQLVQAVSYKFHKSRIIIESVVGSLQKGRAVTLVVVAIHVAGVTPDLGPAGIHNSGPHLKIRTPNL